MTENLYSEWMNLLFDAKNRSNKVENIRAFKGIHREQAARASYFTEMDKVIGQLGLSNPHESSALSLEPTHPVQNHHLGRAFDNLRISSVIQQNYKDCKLSLISLEMLRRYSPKSDAKRIIASGFNSPLYLLDPLYGFVYLPKKDKIYNHCFAIDIWSSHINSMPAQLSKELWKNRADNMLFGGAFAGRFLFKDLIPQENDPLKLPTPPVIQVNSEAELRDIIRELESSVENTPNVELWFRGQNKDYQTPDRSVLTQLGITPYSNIIESDFTPSLYRSYDNFTDSTDKYEELVLELAEWVHHANQVLPNKNESIVNDRVVGVATVDGIGLGSYQRGLLLQQYGAPSAYLDITHAPSIAAWFATRKCTMNDGKMIYSEHSWSGTSPDEWPTIYVFPLVKDVHPYLDLNSIFTNRGAERAERQKCGLLGGAGNLARNYCARYLGMKIRLGPNFKISSPYSAEDLFPPESEDSVLKILKETNLKNTKRHFPLSELA
jgi:hypothetical protein